METLDYRGNSRQGKELVNTCPVCGSISLSRRSRRKKGEILRAYRCKNCGEIIQKPVMGLPKTTKHTDYKLPSSLLLLVGGGC